MNFAINFEGNAKEQALDAQAAVASLEKAMKALDKATVVDIATHRKLSQALTVERDKLAGLTVAQVKAEESTRRLAKAREDLGKLATPIKAIIGFAALATAGIIGLIAAGTKFSEERGDAERMLETVFQSEEAAKHTYDVIANVTKRVAISQDRAIEIADALARAGSVNGDNMVRAIESVGKAEAARKGAGQVIQGVIERAEKARSTGFGTIGGFSISRDEIRAAGLFDHV